MSESARINQAARNLPSTASPMLTGNVINNSIEPDLRSSAQLRIAMAGTRNKYNQG